MDWRGSKTEDLIKITIGLATGAYGFAFFLHMRLSDKIEGLTREVFNHHATEIEGMKNELEELKKRLREVK